MDHESRTLRVRYDLPIVGTTQKEKEEKVSWPVSRVLSPSVRRPLGDDHSSGTPIAVRLVATNPNTRPENRLLDPGEPGPAWCSYSVLLPVGFSMPAPLPTPRWALTPPFHPYLSTLESRAGGLLSVALSLGSPPPGVTRHRVSLEPGLSSPDAFRHCRERPSSQLTS